MAGATSTLKLDPMHVRVLQSLKPGQSRVSFYSWAAMALLVLLFVSTSFGPVILNWTEGLYAGAVREMHSSGDWLDPTNNGFLRIEKPPLIYWILLCSTSVFGFNEFGLRLPVSLVVAGWVGFIFLIMRRLGGERLGLAAALIVSTMIGTRVFAEILQPEAFLAFFSTGAIWCLVEARSFDELEIDIHASRSRWYLLFWVFLALGALSKGLHGALWPLGGALLTAAVFPSTRYWLRRIAGLAGFGIFLLITLPWYIYMTLRWPGFLTEHFWNEQLRTAASVRFPLYNLKVPFFAFLLHQLIAMLPWSLGLPAAVWFAIKKKSQLHGADKDIVALLAMTFLLEAASLSFSSRFTYYGVSAWGWVAGFLALPWRDDPVWCRWSNRIYLILPGAMVLFAAIFYLGLANKYATQPFEVIVSGIRDSELKSLFVLSPSLFSSPLFATGCLGVLLLLGGVFIGCFWYKNQPFSMLVATAISMLAPFAFVSFALNKISPFDSLARAAQVINQRIVPKTNPVVVWAGDPDACSSLFVYLNTRPHYLDAQFDREYAQRVLGLGRDFYLQDKDFIRLWNSQRPVYLICTGPRWRYWQAGGLLSDHVHEIYNAGNYVVVTNSGPGAN